MIDVKNVSKLYTARGKTIAALDDLSLHVDRGEFVVVRGPSGSGKTTLLLTVGGMLRPDRGLVSVAGEDLYTLDGAGRAKFRAAHIGFVFQMFHLLPYLNVRENVMVAAAKDKKSDVDALLQRLGLEARAGHRPAALSAGEKQRTAVARALINRPDVILADEPTGNLDPTNAEQVIEHLLNFHKQGGTVILVTHGHGADEVADRVVRLEKGAMTQS